MANTDTDTETETLTVNHERFCQMMLDRIQEAVEAEKESAVLRLDTIICIMEDLEDLRK